MAEKKRQDERCPYCHCTVGVTDSGRFVGHFPSLTAPICPGSHTQARWTIGEINAANKAAGRYFFSRDTLKHFKDSPRNWGVWHKDGRIFIHHKQRGQVREFDPTSGNISLAADSVEVLLQRYPGGYREGK